MGGSEIYLDAVMCRSEGFVFRQRAGALSDPVVFLLGGGFE